MAVEERPVMVMWGDPIHGFKLTGPLMPNSDEIEDITDGVLANETWWYVQIIDPYTMTREDV